MYKYPRTGGLIVKVADKCLGLLPEVQRIIASGIRSDDQLEEFLVQLKGFTDTTNDRDKERKKAESLLVRAKTYLALYKTVGAKEPSPIPTHLLPLKKESLKFLSEHKVNYVWQISEQLPKKVPPEIIEDLSVTMTNLGYGKYSSSNNWYSAGNSNPEDLEFIVNILVTYPEPLRAPVSVLSGRSKRLDLLVKNLGNKTLRELASMSRGELRSSANVGLNSKITWEVRSYLVLLGITPVSD